MVFVETETGVPLYHNLQKGEIKNLLTADLAIARAVKLCYTFAKSTEQFFLFDKLRLSYPQLFWQRLCHMEKIC